ncbi:hypothetical protein VOLCADRAFT_97763, partial [Volvox carteri f. nagariensis]
MGYGGFIFTALLSLVILVATSIFLLRDRLLRWAAHSAGLSEYGADQLTWRGCKRLRLVLRKGPVKCIQLESGELHLPAAGSSTARALWLVLRLVLAAAVGGDWAKPGRRPLVLLRLQGLEVQLRAGKSPLRSTDGGRDGAGGYGRGSGGGGGGSSTVGIAAALRRPSSDSGSSSSHGRSPRISSSSGVDGSGDGTAGRRHGRGRGGGKGRGSGAVALPAPLLRVLPLLRLELNGGSVRAEVGPNDPRVMTRVAAAAAAAAAADAGIGIAAGGDAGTRAVPVPYMRQSGTVTVSGGPGGSGVPQPQPRTAGATPVPVTGVANGSGLSRGITPGTAQPQPAIPVQRVIPATTVSVNLTGVEFVVRRPEAPAAVAATATEITADAAAAAAAAVQAAGASSPAPAVGATAVTAASAALVSGRCGGVGVTATFGGRGGSGSSYAPGDRTDPRPGRLREVVADVKEIHVDGRTVAPAGGHGTSDEGPEVTAAAAAAAAVANSPLATALVALLTSSIATDRSFLKTRREKEGGSKTAVGEKPGAPGGHSLDSRLDLDLDLADRVAAWIRGTHCVLPDQVSLRFAGLRAAATVTAATIAAAEAEAEAQPVARVNCGRRGGNSASALVTAAAAATAAATTTAATLQLALGASRVDITTVTGGGGQGVGDAGGGTGEQPCRANATTLLDVSVQLGPVAALASAGGPATSAAAAPLYFGMQHFSIRGRTVVAPPPPPPQQQQPGHGGNGSREVPRRSYYSIMIDVDLPATVLQIRPQMLLPSMNACIAGDGGEVSRSGHSLGHSPLQPPQPSCYSLLLRGITTKAICGFSAMEADVPSVPPAVYDSTGCGGGLQDVSFKSSLAMLTAPLGLRRQMQIKGGRSADPGGMQALAAAAVAAAVSGAETPVSAGSSEGGDGSVAAVRPPSAPLPAVPEAPESSGLPSGPVHERSLAAAALPEVAGSGSGAFADLAPLPEGSAAAAPNVTAWEPPPAASAVNADKTQDVACAETAPPPPSPPPPAAASGAVPPAAAAVDAGNYGLGVGPTTGRSSASTVAAISSAGKSAGADVTASLLLVLQGLELYGSGSCSTSTATTSDSGLGSGEAMPTVVAATVATAPAFGAAGVAAQVPGGRYDIVLLQRTTLNVGGSAAPAVAQRQSNAANPSASPTVTQAVAVTDVAVALGRLDVVLDPWQLTPLVRLSAHAKAAAAVASRAAAAAKAAATAAAAAAASAAAQARAAAAGAAGESSSGGALLQEPMLSAAAFTFPADVLSPELLPGLSMAGDAAAPAVSGDGGGGGCAVDDGRRRRREGKRPRLPAWVRVRSVTIDSSTGIRLSLHAEVPLDASFRNGVTETSASAAAGAAVVPTTLETTVESVNVAAWPNGGGGGSAAAAATANAAADSLVVETSIVGLSMAAVRAAPVPAPTDLKADRHQVLRVNRAKLLAMMPVAAAASGAANLSTMAATAAAGAPVLLPASRSRDDGGGNGNGNGGDGAPSFPGVGAATESAFAGTAGGNAQGRLVRVEVTGTRGSVDVDLALAGLAATQALADVAVAARRELGPVLVGGDGCGGGGAAAASATTPSSGMDRLLPRDQSTRSRSRPKQLVVVEVRATDTELNVALGAAEVVTVAAVEARASSGLAAAAVEALAVRVNGRRLLDVDYLTAGAAEPFASSPPALTPMTAGEPVFTAAPPQPPQAAPAGKKGSPVGLRTAGGGGAGVSSRHLSRGSVDMEDLSGEALQLPPPPPPPQQQQQPHRRTHRRHGSCPAVSGSGNPLSAAALASIHVVGTAAAPPPPQPPPRPATAALQPWTSLGRPPAKAAAAMGGSATAATAATGKRSASPAAAAIKQGAVPQCTVNEARRRAARERFDPTKEDGGGGGGGGAGDGGGASVPQPKRAVSVDVALYGATLTVSYDESAARVYVVVEIWSRAVKQVLGPRIAQLRETLRNLTPRNLKGPGTDGTASVAGIGLVRADADTGGSSGSGSGSAPGCTGADGAAAGRDGGAADIVRRPDKAFVEILLDARRLAVVVEHQPLEAWLALHGNALRATATQRNLYDRLMRGHVGSCAARGRRDVVAAVAGASAAAVAEAAAGGDVGSGEGVQDEWAQAAVMVAPPGCNRGREVAEAVIRRVDSPASEGVMFERVVAVSLAAAASDLQVTAAALYGTPPHRSFLLDAANVRCPSAPVVSRGPACLAGCGGPSSPALTCGQAAVSGWIIRARQLAAPPRSAVAKWPVGRYLSAPVATPLRFCRPNMKTYTDLRVEMDAVSAAFGTAMEPVLAQLAKAFKQRVVPPQPQLLQPSGQLAPQQQPPPSGLPPWDNIRYVWRGGMKVMIRGLNAVAAASSLELPITAHDPRVTLSASTLGVKLSSGQVDLTATALSVLGFARGPGRGPGERLVTVPLLALPLLKTSLHTAFKQRSPTPYAFPLLSGPLPEGAVQLPLWAPVPLPMHHQQPQQPQHNATLALTPRQQQQQQQQQQPAVSAGGVEGIARVYIGEMQGEGCRWVSEAHKRGLAKGSKGLRGGVIVAVVFWEVKFILGLVHGLANGAPVMTRGSWKRRTHFGPALWPPQPPPSASSPPTGAAATAAASSSSSAAADRVAAAAGGAAGGGAGGGSLGGLSLGVLLSRVDINLSADVFDIVHDAQDADDPSDLVCLRTRKLRYANTFSYSRAIRTTPRSNGTSRNKLVARPIMTALSVEAYDIRIFIPSASEAAAPCTGDPWDGADPAAGPGFGAGLIATCDCLLLRQAEPEGSSSSAEASQPLTMWPSAQAAGPQPQPQQPNRPIRIVVQDVQVLCTTDSRDAVIATTVHIIEAFSRLPGSAAARAAAAAANAANAAKAAAAGGGGSTAAGAGAAGGGSSTLGRRMADVTAPGALPGRGQARTSLVLPLRTAPSQRLDSDPLAEPQIDPRVIAEERALVALLRQQNEARRAAARRRRLERSSGSTISTAAATDPDPAGSFNSDSDDEGVLGGGLDPSDAQDVRDAEAETEAAVPPAAASAAAGRASAAVHTAEQQHPAMQTLYEVEFVLVQVALISEYGGSSACLAYAARQDQSREASAMALAAGGTAAAGSSSAAGGGGSGGLRPSFSPLTDALAASAAAAASAASAAGGAGSGGGLGQRSSDVTAVSGGGGGERSRPWIAPPGSPLDALTAAVPVNPSSVPRGPVAAAAQQPQSQPQRLQPSGGRGNSPEGGSGGSGGLKLDIDVPAITGQMESWQFQLLLAVINETLAAPLPKVVMLTRGSGRQPLPAVESDPQVAGTADMLISLKQQLRCLQYESLTLASYLTHGSPGFHDPYPTYLSSLPGPQPPGPLTPPPQLMLMHQLSLSQTEAMAAAIPHGMPYTAMLFKPATMVALLAPRPAGLNAVQLAALLRRNQELLLHWVLDQVSGAQVSVEKVASVVVRLRSEVAAALEAQQHQRRKQSTSVAVRLGRFGWALINKEGAPFVQAELKGLSFHHSLDRDHTGTTKIVMHTADMWELNSPGGTATGAAAAAAAAVGTAAVLTSKGSGAAKGPESGAVGGGGAAGGGGGGGGGSTYASPAKTARGGGGGGGGWFSRRSATTLPETAAAAAAASAVALGVGGVLATAAAGAAAAPLDPAGLRSATAMMMTDARQQHQHGGAQTASADLIAASGAAVTAVAASPQRGQAPPWSSVHSDAYGSGFSGAVGAPTPSAAASAAGREPALGLGTQGRHSRVSSAVTDEHSSAAVAPTAAAAAAAIPTAAALPATDGAAVAAAFPASTTVAVR